MRAPLLALALGGCAWGATLGMAGCSKAPEAHKGSPPSAGDKDAIEGVAKEPAIRHRVDLFGESSAIAIPSENSGLPANADLYAALAADRAGSAKLAAALAANLANQATKKKYDREPFAADDSEAILEDNRWVWRARKGLGKGDVSASVSFATDGTTPWVVLGNSTSAWE